ncbi:hypothetical protein HDV02_005092 [Globomyces sp. JEL0801]|nr:hypothetical protein HDV02_005092 [Globomyces sp. JEL0801]
MAEMDSKVNYTNTIQSQVVRDDRLVVVCFHGQSQNNTIFEYQMSAITKACEKDIQFVFMQGDVPSKNFDLSSTGMEHYDWWINADNAYEKSLKVYERLQKFERVDAIFGFSQGASLVELLDRLASERKVEKLWSISILASGVPLDVQELNCSKKLTELSLHFSGKLEEDRIGSSMLERYERQYSKTIQHEFGHEIPKDSYFASYLHDALLATYTLVDSLKEKEDIIPVSTRVRIAILYTAKLTNYHEFCNKLLDLFDQTNYTLSLILVKVKTPSTFRRLIQDDRKEYTSFLQDLESIGPVDVLLGLPGTSFIFHKLQNQINSGKYVKTWSLDVQFAVDGNANAYDINDDKSVIKFLDKIKDL